MVSNTLHILHINGQSRRNPKENTPEKMTRLYLNKRKQQQKIQQYMMIIDMSMLERCHEEVQMEEGRVKERREKEHRGQGGRELR